MTFVALDNTNGLRKKKIMEQTSVGERFYSRISVKV